MKSCFKNRTEEKREDNYHQKERQSEIYTKKDQKCNIWLEQNLTPRKTSAIMSMLEQMIETRAWTGQQGDSMNAVSADCVVNKKRLYIIFWLDAKQYQAVST